MEDEKKKRGRPPLSPEEKEKRKVAKAKYNAEYQKKRGWVSQKKYKSIHKGEIYEPKIRIPSENKSTLEGLLKNTGLSITSLFVDAVKDKYGVDLLSKKR